MTTALDVLVLPAFDDLPGVPGEATPWYEQYDLDNELQIEGVPQPVHYTDHGLGVVPTGVGKLEAATTTTALLASDQLDLADTLFLTVGVAGGPPTLAIGSVVVTETIVDWDDKCRFDPEGEEIPLTMNPHTEGQGAYFLNETLVSEALSLAEETELRAAERSAAAEQKITTPEEPAVLAGTNLSGDELWHGKAIAEQADWLVDQYDAESFLVTEMEDIATAAALDRFDALDQYLSIRGVSNYDRPLSGESARESLFSSEFEGGFEIGIENAVSVARQIVNNRLA